MSRVFSLAWLLAFTKSFAWLVCCVVGLFTPRKKPLQQAACDFRWACSSDTSKILGVDTWLTGFETGFNQLNNSRVLIFYSFDVQTGARVILPSVCRVSTKRIEDFQSTELFQNQVFDFLSVLGVVFFCKWWRCLRKFSNSSRKIHLYPFALLHLFRNNLELDHNPAKSGISVDLQ